MSGLFQTRNITCGCGRDLRVPVLGDVYSLTREATEQEARQEAELLMKSAIDDAALLRADVGSLKAKVESLLDALDAIRQYGSDTLSGRTDGPDDRAWQRAAVLEMTRRARRALEGCE